MKWNEKPNLQKAVFVVSLLCFPAALLQGVGLLFWDIYVFPQPLYHLLFAVGCVGVGSEGKLAVFWYVSAVFHVLAAILTFLK